MFTSNLEMTSKKRHKERISSKDGPVPLQCLRGAESASAVETASVGETASSGPQGETSTLSLVRNHAIDEIFQKLGKIQGMFEAWYHDFSFCS